MRRHRFPKEIDRRCTGQARRCVPLHVHTVSCALALFGSAQAEIVVDGLLDEPEWQDAKVCADWGRTQPYAQDQPRYRNELRIASTPEGLIAAFTLDHPPSEPRVKTRSPRDAGLPGDSVTLVVDFDANGQIGYEFSVGLGGGVRDGLVLNQNEFDRDWDGVWQHSVRETADQWVVELKVPWTTVSMRDSDAEQRTIAIYANRYLFERAERFACPAIDLARPAFLSDLQRFTFSRQENAQSFDLIPYSTASSDLLHDSTEWKAGADIVWKPSARLRMAAALNPDFGQVETDELVVDFSAIETSFTDKRPFFTEDQGIFDLRTPARGQLIYTRRIGAAPDDDSAGSANIDAALKLTGSTDQLAYGVFAAQEEDYSAGFGRLFTATRVAMPLPRARIGHLASWTDRPLLERSALINAVDAEVTPSDWWRLAGQVIRSDIQQQAVRSEGYEAWLQADLNRSGALSHTVTLLSIDDRFEMDDLGFLERNALRQGERETNRHIASPDPGQRVSGETQRLYLQYRENTDGQRLASRMQISRDVQYTSTWRAYQELRYVPSAVDDLISRGNGIVRMDQRASAYVEFATPRYGKWSYDFATFLFQQGVSGYSVNTFLRASWFPSDSVTASLAIFPEWSDDWLLWERDNLFGSYSERRLDFDFRLDWIPAPRHELRMRWQWIGIQAEPRRVYRTDPRGELITSTDTLAPFTVNNLGVQLRYRYEIGPLSDLFFVYGRGGYRFMRDDRDVDGLFGNMLDVRDADQLLLKIRLRM
jgi:hypothetical protein